MQWVDGRDSKPLTNRLHVSMPTAHLVKGRHGAIEATGTQNLGQVRRLGDGSVKRGLVSPTLVGRGGK